MRRRRRTGRPAATGDARLCVCMCDRKLRRKENNMSRKAAARKMAFLSALIGGAILLYLAYKGA